MTSSRKSQDNADSVFIFTWLNSELKASLEDVYLSLGQSCITSLYLISLGIEFSNASNSRFVKWRQFKVIFSYISSLGYIKKNKIKNCLKCLSSKHEFLFSVPISR